MKLPRHAPAGAGQGVGGLLGELEHEVMVSMWERGEATVRDVLVVLNARRRAGRRLAYTTVLTVLTRLTEKNLLDRRLLGRAHIYSVAQSREDFVARASRDMARRMVESFGEAAIASFLDVLDDVAPERLAALRRRAGRHGTP